MLISKIGHFQSSCMFDCQVPVLNHWWQTETGHSITASCVGFGHNLYPPMFSAGMPFPGYDGNFLRTPSTNRDCGGGEIE